LAKKAAIRAPRIAHHIGRLDAQMIEKKASVSAIFCMA